MALGEAKICSVCGQEYRGMGNICKDGCYCDACAGKVRLVFEEDEADYLSAAAIRAKLNRYAAAIAAYDTVEKPENCPICGKKLPKVLNLRLLDGYICMNCGEKAAGLLHSGYDAVRCRCLSEIRPLFETAVMQGGRTDESGLFYDAASLRVVYPLIRTLREDPEYDLQYDVEYIDPLDSLSGEELRAAPALAERRRAELRDRYGPRKAVFEVDDVTKLYNESKGRLYYRNEYRISGRVLLGNIALRDQAVVGSAGRAQPLRIRKLGDCRKYSTDLKELREGTEGALFVEAAVSFVYPGDILLID